MKDIIYYNGREQTYLKHFFLERYLERVAYVIGSTFPNFVYVDGFSGPWKSEDENFQDTSFIIAINKLRSVREGLASKNVTPSIRCLFIENDPTAFSELQRAVSDVTDLEVQVLLGDFEELIPDILEFIGKSFSLVFIDPTGWTGFGLNRIKPILEHDPGEVLVNFMYDFINRFIGDPQHAESFNDLMGGPVWKHLPQSERREEETIELYRKQMCAAGNFKHVTWTRILKPISDRSYFYLHYGTRHVKGLREFRSVEKAAVKEQERIRLEAKQLDRVARSGQRELFGVDSFTGPSSFEEERKQHLSRAKSGLRELLQTRKYVDFEDALALCLEMPFVWESDVKCILKEMRKSGEIDVRGLKPRERTVKAGHVLISKMS